MEETGISPSMHRLEAAARNRPPRAQQHDLMTAAHAQPDVNFVILMPPLRRNQDGESTEILGTLRREAAPAIRSDVGGGKWPSWSTISPCSFRFEVSSQGHLYKRVITFFSKSPEVCVLTFRSIHLRVRVELSVSNSVFLISAQ